MRSPDNVKGHKYMIILIVSLEIAAGLVISRHDAISGLFL